MASTYLVYGATTAALTAPPVAVASSGSANTVRTVAQFKFTQAVHIKEWGYSLTAIPTAPCEIELVDTGLIAATMATAFIAGDFIKYNNANADTPPVTLGTGASGFGVASAEGTVTATRLLGFRYENGLWVEKQIPLGDYPEVLSTNYLRIRITPTTAAVVSILPYIMFEV